MTNNPQSPTSDVPDGEIIEVMEPAISISLSDSHTRIYSKHFHKPEAQAALTALRATFNVTITKREA